MDIGTINYLEAMPPPGYCCTKCGKHGVKLWRQYQTLADYIELLCATCAVKDQGKDWEIGEDGRHADSDFPEVRCDQIGWLVPAVPTEEGDTYWGYTSVPLRGVRWWKRLPTHPGGTSTYKDLLEGDALISFDAYLSEVDKAYRENRGWRLGQTYFNILHRIKPDLANAIRTTEADPFDSCGKLNEFLRVAERFWACDPVTQEDVERLLAESP